MKKLYTKPEIMFEDFTLSTNIAGDCKTITNTPSSGNCAYEIDAGAFGTYHVFVNEVAACTTKDYDLDNDPDGIYNGICYHVPTDGLFNS